MQGVAVIHYHGFPITPDTAAVEVAVAGHTLISHRHRGQTGLAVELSQSFIFDNGAFSAWKHGEPVKDWSAYYRWVDDFKMHPGFDWAIIPDVIDGDEDANDNLIEDWPHGAVFGVPVWHLHESTERLVRLCKSFPRVCFGSSGDFATIGTSLWWARIHEAFFSICNHHGQPIAKIHGLRMLNPKIFTKLPFSSADSSNIGRNVGMDDKWKSGTYSPMTKAARASVMRKRVEHFNSAQRWIDPLFS